MPPSQGGFSPGPSAAQDPALAALNATPEPVVRPEDIMPDVTQDPALARLTAGTYEQRPPEPEAPAPAPRPQNSQRTININSPAAVRAAMRSGNSVDQIVAQNAAKASSSNAVSYDTDAEETGRSGCLIWIIILFIAFFIGLIAFAVWPALSKEMTYKNAVTALSENHYSEAIDSFKSLEDYKDSKLKVKESYYKQGCAHQKAERYDSAITAFSEIDPYEDSSQRIAECRYELGKNLIAEGLYDKAYDQLYLIPKYEDAGDLAMEANYKAAVELLNKENYEAAAMRFGLFPDYEDSSEQYKYCEYTYGKLLFDAEQYDAAYKAFKAAGSYEDAMYISALSQFNSIITETAVYSHEDMQSVLLILTTNSNYEDAQTILETHVYDLERLVGTWTLGNASMTFEFTDTGNKLTTNFDGTNEKVYENVAFDNGTGQITTADGSTAIITIYRFSPNTQAQPGSIEFHAVELEEDVVFNRS